MKSDKWTWTCHHRSSDHMAIGHSTILYDGTIATHHIREGNWRFSGKRVVNGNDDITVNCCSWPASKTDQPTRKEGAQWKDIVGQVIT